MASGSRVISVDFEIFGKVQGVFFRKHTEKTAKGLGLVGWCENTPQDTVQGQVQGREEKVAEMKKWLQTKGSPKSKIAKAVFTEIVLVLCYIYIKCSAVNHFIRSGSKQNVLIVTAHPDDECMFFAPTILSLLREGHQIYLVCLSKGNFYGQGELRKKELLASCAKLGIPHSNVTIIEDERFQDGPENVWSIDGIVERVSGVVKRVGANSVVTFDGHGVSSHPNHVALFKAARRMVHEKVIKGCQYLF